MQKADFVCEVLLIVKILTKNLKISFKIDLKPENEKEWHIKQRILGYGCHKSDL